MKSLEHILNSLRGSVLYTDVKFFKPFWSYSWRLWANNRSGFRRKLL